MSPPGAMPHCCEAFCTVMCSMWPGFAEQGGWCLPADICCLLSGPAIFVLLSQTWQSQHCSESLSAAVPFMISSWPEVEGAVPRLRGCHGGTTWLYNSAFISLTSYLQLGKGRNGGNAYREVAVVGLLHLSCQFRSWAMQYVK